MICGVRGCAELAIYLIRIGDISFCLCEKHKKGKWTMKTSKKEIELLECCPKGVKKP